eukprot:1188580-Prorocentrum_minimum.AAC.9
MGTNCAGFLANLYCFTYEFDVLKRVVDDKNFTLAQEMLWTKRYIDELIAVNWEFCGLAAGGGGQQLTFGSLGGGSYSPKEPIGLLGGGA